MAAYIVVEIEITDPDLYEKYKSLAPASIAAYGGRYIVRGGAVKCFEGDWSPKRLVILEFESAEQAEKWWNSSEYHQAKRMRQAAARTRMVLVQGAS